MVKRILTESGRVLSDVVASRSGHTVRVLLYHSISDDQKDPLAVSPETFRQHVHMLAESQIRVASCGELLQMMSGEEHIRRSVCITFDDGFEDFATAALPILKEYGFPSTLFVSTGLTGTNAIWPTWSKQRRFLNWKELKDLAGEGVEIGSHAVNHVRMSLLPDQELRIELEQSHADLRQHLNNYLHAIAYPYGDYSPNVLRMAEAAGYRAGFAVGGLWGNRRGMNKFSLRRTQVIAATSPEHVREVVNGRNDRKEITKAFTDRIR